MFGEPIAKKKQLFVSVSIKGKMENSSGKLGAASVNSSVHSLKRKCANVVKTERNLFDQILSYPSS